MIGKAINFLRSMESLLSGTRTRTVQVTRTGEHYEATFSTVESPRPHDFSVGCTDSTADKAINRLAVIVSTNDEDTAVQNAELCELMATELVGRIANFYGGEELIRAAFRKALTHEHRTIQQSFISALKLIIEDYAKDRYEIHAYDGRNEFSVQWANEVQRLNEKQGHMGHRFPMV